ncbi:hypothetical protein K440DRAFT_660714 [Wilcoxina mikolae CBS 423.85]|nr:hypothetical protein K440DRAFT_660714 [Wilcoxina mikolae CBS 423.85]
MYYHYLTHASLYCTSLTCHRLRTLSEPLLYYTLRIRFGKTNAHQHSITKDLLKRLLGNPAIASYVHRVILHDSQSKNDQGLLEEAICALPRLQDLVVRSRSERIPAAILSTIRERHTQIRIHIDRWVYPNEIDSALWGNLYSVDLRMENMEYREIVEIVDEMLRCCKTLQVFQVCFRRPWAYSSQTPFRLPPLETDQQHLSSIRDFGLLYCPITIAEWSNRLNISLIRRLSVFYPALISKDSFYHEELAQQLVNLDSLVVKQIPSANCEKCLHPWEDKAISPAVAAVAHAKMRTFLERCRPLKSLDLQPFSKRELLATINVCHGPTLRNLRMHNREWHQMPCQREVLDVDDIQSLCVGCPHLESLAVDINRSGEWPFGVFNALTEFSALKTLTLSFELGRETTHWVTPFVTLSSARWIFGCLRARRPGLCRLLAEIGTVMHTSGYLSGQRRVIDKEDLMHDTISVTTEGTTMNAISSKLSRVRRALEDDPSDLEFGGHLTKGLKVATLFAEEGPLPFNGCSRCQIEGLHPIS